MKWLKEHDKAVKIAKTAAELILRSVDLDDNTRDLCLTQFEAGFYKGFLAGAEAARVSALGAMDSASNLQTGE